MSKPIEELYLEVVADLSDVKKDLKKLGAVVGDFTNKAEREVKSLSGQFAKLGLAIDGVQRVMGIAARGVRGLIAPYGDLEVALRGVQKTTGMTDRELAVLEKDFDRLSVKTGITAVELAGIAEAAGQLGIRGVENISKFTETIAMMGRTTDLGVEESAARMAQLSNIFEEPIGNVERLGDVINELSNTTTAKARDIVEGVRRIGRAGGNLKFGFSDVAGISATLKDLGIDAERGGTAVRNIFIRMQTESEKLAKQMGISRREFEAMLSEDGKQTLLAYLDTLRGMDKIGRSTAIKDVFGQESFLAIANMADGVDLLRRNMEAANTAFETGGSLRVEFANQMRSLYAQGQRFVNAWKVWFFRLGRAVFPYLTGVVKVMTTGLSNMETFARNAWQVMKPLVGAVAGYYSMIGARLVAEKTLFVWRRLQAIWTNRGAIAQRALNLAMSANPLGLVLKLLAMFVGALVATGGNLGVFKLTLEALWMTVRDVFRNFWEIAKLVLYGLAAPFTFAFNVVKGFASGFRQIFRGITEVLGGFWDVLTGNFDQGWERIQKGFTQFTQEAGAAFKKAIQNTAEPMTEVWEKIDFSESKAAWVKAGKETYAAFTQGVDEAAEDNPVEVPEPDLGKVEGAAGSAVGIVDEAAGRMKVSLEDVMKGFFKSTVQGVAGMGNALQSALNRLSDMFLDWVWQNYLVQKIFRDKSVAEDTEASAKMVANSSAVAGANMVEAGTDVSASAAKSAPFPGNLLLIAGGIATLLSLFSSLKSKSKGLAAFAKGGVADHPMVGLFGEGEVPELFAPQPDFLKYANQTLTPMIRAQVEAKLNREGGGGDQGLHRKIDELIDRLGEPVEARIRGSDLVLVQNRALRGVF